MIIATEKLPRHVIVFAPYVEGPRGLISPHYDLPEYHAEVACWMESLGLTWEWQPVTSRNLPILLNDAVKKVQTKHAMVLNLCDGSESDGYPGVEVVEGLQESRIPFTGADADFYRITTSKVLTKQALILHGVQTSPYVLIRDADADLQRAASEIGFPLFFKPDISAGSMGIHVDSVCHDLESAHRKLLQLYSGQHGEECGKNGVLIERYIDGREFTVLTVADSNAPMGLWVLSPGERVFDHRIPKHERFLAYERYWSLPEDDRPIPVEDPYYWYACVEDGLSDELESLARHAMLAVGGVGYGRVDIRQDERSGKLYVLEVNAQCGISSDDSSTVGSLLRLAGVPMTDVLKRVLHDGMIRYVNRAQ